MPDKGTVEIVVTPDGKVSIQVRGVKGKGCLSLTKDLEERLGVPMDRKLTSEYYQVSAGDHARTRL